MGGGPTQTLLIIINAPESSTSDKINEIRKRFPDVKVEYFQSQGLFGVANDEEKKNLNELFKEATILATFGIWPEKPEDAPNLNLIHLFSAGVDHFLTHPIFTSTSIPITTSNGIHGVPISEWILSAVLASSKNAFLSYENQKKHQWGSQSDRGTYMAQTDWVGKRVAIAGYGSIGRQVARVFVAMGAEVLAYTASPRSTAEARKDKAYVIPGTGDPEGIWPKAWYSGTSKESLHTFLGQEVDCLVNCLPLTDATRHLLGREEFEIMKRGNAGKSAYFVNISRGAIVRQSELVQCLNDGTLAGAAVDVTDPEPLPEGDELWEAKNVIVSPHVSGIGREYMGRAYDVLMVNLGRLEKGEPLINEVKRKRGY